jgi:cation:H+ antiporter
VSSRRFSAKLWGIFQTLAAFGPGFCLALRMTSAIAQFAVSALIIIVAGTILTYTADAIADITKLGKLLIGSILLAGATSLPELAVDIHAVRNDMADLAVGALFGSSLFNLLIVALIDLIYRSRGTVFSRSYAAHALSATMSSVLTALAGMALVLGSRYPELLFLNASPGTWLIAAAYILGVRMAYYDQHHAAIQLEEDGAISERVLPSMSLWTAVAGFVAAAVVIVVVAPYLAESADVIAIKSGLGKTFIGTTLVALSTSLPELVATATAVRIGSADLALGNIFGSNAFNMLLFLPLDIVCPGSLMAQASSTHLVTAFCTIIVTSVAVMGQLYNVKHRNMFVDPGAILMIVLILASLYLVYLLG